VQLTKLFWKLALEVWKLLLNGLQLRKVVFPELRLFGFRKRRVQLSRSWVKNRPPVSSTHRQIYSLKNNLRVADFYSAAAEVKEEIAKALFALTFRIENIVYSYLQPLESPVLLCTGTHVQLHGPLSGLRLTRDAVSGKLRRVSGERVSRIGRARA